jgi:hypothetical protein
MFKKLTYILFLLCCIPCALQGMETPKETKPSQLLYKEGTIEKLKEVNTEITEWRKYKFDQTIAIEKQQKSFFYSRTSLWCSLILILAPWAFLTTQRLVVHACPNTWSFIGTGLLSLAGTGLLVGHVGTRVTTNSDIKNRDSQYETGITFYKKVLIQIIGTEEAQKAKKFEKTNLKDLPVVFNLSMAKQPLTELTDLYKKIKSFNDSDLHDPLIPFGTFVKRNTDIYNGEVENINEMLTLENAYL